MASKQLSYEFLTMVAARFRVLGEPARLRILSELQDCEKTVSELIASTGLNQSNLSRHLLKLAEAGIVSRRKEGLSVLYRVADPAIFKLCSQVCDGIRSDLSRKDKAMSRSL